MGQFIFIVFIIVIIILSILTTWGWRHSKTVDQEMGMVLITVCAISAIVLLTIALNIWKIINV